MKENLMKGDYLEIRLNNLYFKILYLIDKF